MRSIAVLYTAKNLKPNTRYFAFFDEIEVTDWVSVDNIKTDFDDGVNRYSGAPNSNRKGFGYPILRMTSETFKVSSLFLTVVPLKRRQHITVK